MADGAAKLECMRDSTGNWMVWDNDRGRPAIFNGKVISGLTELQARSIARILGGIYSTRLDAESVRHWCRQHNH